MGNPGTLKNHLFALLDAGFTRAEVRYLLRQFRDPQRSRTFPETIRKYELMWRAKEADRA